VAFFACGLSVATGLVFGLAPLSTAIRTDSSAALTSAGRITGQPSGRRLRNALVTADLAIAFALVMVAGLLGQSLGNLYTLDAGFDPSGVLTLTPFASAAGPAKTDVGRLAYYRTLMQRVAAVPGVTSVGMVSNVPLSNIEPARVITDADDAGSSGRDADWFVVGGDYFGALRIPLLAGRPFDSRDDNASDKQSVIVSAAFAMHRLPGLDPLHRRLRFEGEKGWYEIVGVVGDVRYKRLDEPPGDAIYIPQSAFVWHYTRLVARTAGDPRGFQRAIEAAISDVDSGEGFFHEQPMDDYVSSSLAARRFPVDVLGLFGVIAVVLSAVGLYGLLGFSVLQRTQEIGVRRALGATPWNVLMLIVREASAVIVCGLAAGAIAAWTASRTISIRTFHGVAPSARRTPISCVR
jgi:predicted permease